MRGTFKIEIGFSDYRINATVSGYDDQGDYYTPPSSESVVEEVSVWDEENNCAVQFETLDAKIQSRIESKLSEEFFKLMSQIGPDDDDSDRDEERQY